MGATVRKVRMMFETLKFYCDIASPGGREDRIHPIVAQRWQHHAERVWLTSVGNLIAHIGGSGPKLMLVGHGDEIGFAVKYISDDGFIYFTTNQRESTGRPPLRSPYFNPMGQRARILTRDSEVPGVFATLTGHILLPTQRAKTDLDWNDLFVDAFMPSREAVHAAGIQIGDRIVWDVDTQLHGLLITGKAMDNRVSLAIFDTLLTRLDAPQLKYDLYLGSTIQEEIGFNGANSINRDVGCEYAISIDTTLSGDVPGVDPRDCHRGWVRAPH